MGADVVDAVRAVAAGKKYFAAAVAARVLRLAGAAAAEALPEPTAPERQVLALVAEGIDNAAIANRLVISPLTVRNHLTKLDGTVALPGRWTG
jgi:DNA-binding NarL/FixJ family response regulator